MTSQYYRPQKIKQTGSNVLYMHQTTSDCTKNSVRERGGIRMATYLIDIRPVKAGPIKYLVNTSMASGELKPHVSKKEYENKYVLKQDLTDCLPGHWDVEELLRKVDLECASELEHTPIELSDDAAARLGWSGLQKD